MIAAVFLVGWTRTPSLPTTQSANHPQYQSIWPLVPVKPFVVTSSTFKDNTRVPLSMVFNGAGSGCKGGNKSPQLTWSGAPLRTRTYTVLMFDVTASFTHWGMYNIPASTTSLPENAGVPGSTYGPQILNDFGIAQRYDGPCPPPGLVHHYVVTVFALDCTLRLPPPLGTFPPFPETLLYGLLEARSDILATASITGLYSR
jgi:Raf kinase inhibitor-like YbhB/YbcL family protein